MAQHHSPPRTGGELLVATLAAHGVDTVFGIPGTHNLGIFAAMPQHGVRNVTTRHEQGAGYAADGYARSSGRIGVFVTTTGPGAVNGATALGQAYSDSVPVLMISPGVPSDHPADGNGLLHDQLDQRAALAGVVAHSVRVRSVAEIPVAVAKAFARMGGGRPRPEYLEVPFDLLDAVAEVAVPAPLEVPEPGLPTTSQLHDAAATLAAVRRPLVVAGGGAAGAGAELERIAERLDAPVMTTINGKGALREDHPLSLGAGMLIDEFPDIVEEADALLVVGSELGQSDWLGRYPSFPETVVRVDVDPNAMLTHLVPTHGLLGDAAAVLDGLLAELGEAPSSAEPSGPTVERARQARETYSAPWLDSMRSLAEVLPEDVVVGADNAMCAYNGALPGLPLRHGRSFLFPTGFGTLGYGLPAAIGAKLANPDRAVIALQGDGGIMFVLSELVTAAEQGLALPVLVYDNGGYGEIYNQIVERGDPVHSVGLTSPDFAGVARSLGCHGERVSDQRELGEVVARALRADRPTVIHIIEDSDTRRALMTSAPW